MDARVKVAERRERVGRHDGIFCLHGAPRYRLRQNSLLACEVASSQVSSRAGNEPPVGGTQEEQPSLDARPEHQCVEHLVEQRSQTLSPGQSANNRLELGHLRGGERDVMDHGRRNASPRHGCERRAKGSGRRLTQGTRGHHSSLFEATGNVPFAARGREMNRGIERRTASADGRGNVDERRKRVERPACFHVGLPQQVLSGTRTPPFPLNGGR